MMVLLTWTVNVTAEEMSFDSKDLRSLSPSQRRKIIGKDIAMIFKELTSSLNPCFTVGFQIKERLSLNLASTVPSNYLSRSALLMLQKV